MFYLNALWLLFMLFWLLNEHYSYSSDYLWKGYEQVLSSEPFVGRCFILVRIGLLRIDNPNDIDFLHADDLLEDVAGTSCCRRDRIYLALATPILKLKCRYNDTKWIEWVPVKTACNVIGYFCYETLNAVFATCAFIAVEMDLSTGKYIGYLDTVQHILFYAVPIVIFVISLVIIHMVKKEDFCWSQFFLAFIIAFCFAFPSYFFYDWSKAKEGYAAAMEEEFGENWQEEVEEMENQYEP